MSEVKLAYTLSRADAAFVACASVSAFMSVSAMTGRAEQYDASFAATVSAGASILDELESPTSVVSTTVVESDLVSVPPLPPKAKPKTRATAITTAMIALRFFIPWTVLAI